VDGGDAARHRAHSKHHRALELGGEHLRAAIHTWHHAETMEQKDGGAG